MGASYIAAAAGARGATFTYNGFTGRVLDWQEDPSPKLHKIDLAPEHGSHLVQENIPLRKFRVQTLVEATPPAGPVFDDRQDGYQPLMGSYDAYLKAMEARGTYPMQMSLVRDRYINCKATKFQKVLRRRDRFWQMVSIAFESYDPFWRDADESSISLANVNPFSIGDSLGTRPRFEVTYDTNVTGFKVGYGPFVLSPEFDVFGPSFEYTYTPASGTVTVIVDCENRTVSNSLVPTNPIQHFSGRFLDLSYDDNVVFIWRGVPTVSSRSMFWRLRWP